MSLVIKFHFTSSMLYMFRTLIHPSSGACDFSIVSPHWSCVLVSLCVGVSVWLSWGGTRVAGWSLPHESMFLNLLLGSIFSLQKNTEKCTRILLHIAQIWTEQRFMFCFECITFHILLCLIKIFMSILTICNLYLTFTGPCIANIFAQYNQQDAKFHNLFISVRRSACFWWFFRPSSGAQNCTYSVRYLPDRYCYMLPVWTECSDGMSPFEHSVQTSGR